MELAGFSKGLEVKGARPVPGRDGGLQFYEWTCPDLLQILFLNIEKILTQEEATRSNTNPANDLT